MASWGPSLARTAVRAWSAWASSLPAELLETAARIFRAEAQDGYRDRVVIGGLFGFVDKLQRSVPDLDGVANLLHDYAALAPAERAARLSEAQALLNGGSLPAAPPDSGWWFPPVRDWLPRAAPSPRP